MPSLDDVESSAELNHPTIALEQDAASGLGKTRQALQLLGAGQPYQPHQYNDTGGNNAA